MSAPQARVVRVEGRAVTIACPFCQALHTHEVPELGHRERRAPACGMFLPPAARAEGYRFYTTTRTTNQEER